MTPEIGMWLLGAFSTVLGFLAVWQFNKSIKTGERITMHDAEIIELRRNSAKVETDLRAALAKTESDLRAALMYQAGNVADAVRELKEAVKHMDGRLDSWMMEQTKAKA